MAAGRLQLWKHRHGREHLHHGDLSSAFSKKQVRQKPPPITGHRQFLSPRSMYWIKSKKQKATAVEGQREQAASMTSFCRQWPLLPSSCLTVEYIRRSAPNLTPSTREGGDKTPTPALQALSLSKRPDRE